MRINRNLLPHSCMCRRNKIHIPYSEQDKTFLLTYMTFSVTSEYSLAVMFVQVVKEFLSLKIVV